MNQLTKWIAAGVTVVASSCGGSGEQTSTEGFGASNETVYNYGTLANPGSCLDARAAGTDDGTQLQEWVCNGTGAQAFAAIDVGNGVVNLLNTNANKCVDISGSGTANGTKVQLWDCNGTAAQTFILRAAQNGFVNIVNTNSNKCLDVQADNPANGTVVQLYDCNGTNAQLWNPAAIGVVTTTTNTPPPSNTTTLAQCNSAQLAACNCPSNFSCCPTDGSCFQSADQIVYTMCKNDPASACAMSGGSPPSPPSNNPPPPSNNGPVSTCGAAVNPGDRVVTITNECPGQTLSIGINGGYVQDCVNGSCPAGSTCSTGRSPPGCFWDFPSPVCGSPALGSGQSATYILRAPASGNTTWSGNVYAATGCAGDGTGCRTAQCARSINGMTVVQACPDGMGPTGPTTLAEFTFVPSGSDFYDVSTINGMNVPISMGPLGGTPDPSNPYTCGTAGAITGSPGLMGCSWSFDPSINVGGGGARDESSLLRAVTPGGASCGSNADCGGGDVCGTALVFGGASVVRTCGTQVGWWTADELCAYTGNGAGGDVQCNQGVGGQGTYANLYGCNGANATSGYNTGATSTSCGCPAWNIDGQSVAVAPGFACYASNPAWQSVAEPWAAFLKNACPTAYSFPFDDATSTFTCATSNTGASSPNSMGYAITFCPGGRTGL